MAEYYDELTASHLGHDKILELLSQNYHLPNARKYIETYIVIYDICTKAKVLYYKLFSLLQLLPILDRIWESVLTDFIVKLLPSRDPGQLKGGEFDSI